MGCRSDGERQEVNRRIITKEVDDVDSDSDSYVFPCAPLGSFMSFIITQPRAIHSPSHGPVHLYSYWTGLDYIYLFLLLFLFLFLPIPLYRYILYLSTYSTTVSTR